MRGIRKAFEEKRRRHAAQEEQNRHQDRPTEKEPVVRRLAPNLDQLLIIGSLGTPPFKPGLVDRLLVLASLEDLPTLLVVNKVDLAESRQQVEQILRVYRAVPVDCLATSTVTGEGIEFLKERLTGKTSAFTGHSGVGKSSLFQAVEPGLEIEVGEVSARIGKGQHTTTELRWYPLSGGGRVFDLPGLKLVPIRTERLELQVHFPEIMAASRACRFDDCAHQHEPDCAVRRAVDEGLVAPSRLASYLRLLEELD